MFLRVKFRFSGFTRRIFCPAIKGNESFIINVVFISDAFDLLVSLCHNDNVIYNVTWVSYYVKFL